MTGARQKFGAGDRTRSNAAERRAWVRCSSPSTLAFHFRTDVGRWRWLLLGALGLAPAACGGKAEGASGPEEGTGTVAPARERNGLDSHPTTRPAAQPLPSTSTSRRRPPRNRRGSSSVAPRIDRWLEAAEAAAHCSDPAARQVLDQIARDETEHARLAWRFVRWALERAPEDVRRAAEAAFFSEHEIEAPSETAPGDLDLALLRQGW